MAFALIIIYAGAILITYLFVIMLATQAPSEEALERLSDYDAASREPMFATIAGFVMLALLTGIMARGLPDADPQRRERDRPGTCWPSCPRRCCATSVTGASSRAWSVPPRAP